MIRNRTQTTIVLAAVICGLLIASALIAGCTSSSAPSQPVAAPVTTMIPATTIAVAVTPGAATIVPLVATTIAVTKTGTPALVYTPSSGNLIVFTAASLKGVSPKIAEDFGKMYPGHKVVFNLDGTQALKTQVENGAYADVFVSASNTYTTALSNGGYFVTGTVKPFTSNYIFVILPASNPANIKSLADLAKPGVKIAMEDKSVPAGTATIGALANLAESTYSADWNKSVFGNVVTYETSEPGVATKVALGEVDAGFVYESTFTAAPKNTFAAITIPKKDNYLQTYTIGILKESANPGTAAMFEDFILSSVGQQDLKDYGFRPL